MNNAIQSLRLIDLIEAGLLPSAAKIYGQHGDILIEGIVQSDGSIRCGDTISSSLSVAAGQAITSKSGRTSPGRNYMSVNGWLFWHIKGRDGATKTLADLRQQMAG
jgi:hypothetical protein